MKRSAAIMFCLLALIFSATGCSRTQKVVVMEGGLSVPYESLGSIEVNRKVPRVSLKRAIQKIDEWVTFGWYKMPSQEDYLKNSLDKALIKAAKKRYCAEVVTEVKYWPDLSAKKFPHGRVYARGEMVRYKRFAS